MIFIAERLNENNNSLQTSGSSANMNMQTLLELEQYVYMRRKEILALHKSKLTQLASGTYAGYWQTFVKDDNNKRKILRAKSKKELEDKVIEFYSSKQGHSIKTCHDGWIEYLAINKKQSTIHAYEKVYRRHFQDIAETAIEGMSILDIKCFVKKEVAEKELTVKGYAALKTNLLGVFHYAKDCYGYDINIDSIVAELSRELRGSFRRSKKRMKSDQELIFLDNEVKQISQLCYESGTQVDLGIQLLFETGLRVGELSALKKEDIAADRQSINVKRTEERISNKAEYIIVDTTKTEAGTREVLLTRAGTKIVSKLLLASNPDSEFLFSDSNMDRYSSKKFRDRLYRICSILGIVRRSPHAIRRTYATKLAMAGVPETIIIKQLGHTDFEVTKMFYIYNNENRSDTIARLNQAI